MTLAVVILFSLAYVCFISALAVSIGKFLGQQLKENYPLIDSPSRTAF